MLLWEKKVQVYFHMMLNFPIKGSQQHMASKQRRTNVGATSWRRIDVGTTLFQGCVSAGLTRASCLLWLDTYIDQLFKIA